MLTACQRAEKKEATEYRKILKSNSKIAENKAFLETIPLLDNFFLEKNNINIDNNKTKNWKDKLRENKSIFEA